jgi:hypothetical protein
MATHAGTQFAVEHPEEAKLWSRNSHSLVVLEVENEDELLDWADQLAGWCGPHAKIDAPWTLFHEPDIREHTALATLLTEDQWHVFSNLNLALQDRKDPRYVRESRLRHIIRASSYEGGE